MRASGGRPEDAARSGFTVGEAHTLTVRASTVFRTGRAFPHRVCPVHGGPLELCVDDTKFSEWSAGHRQNLDHHDNRVCWRCESCLGYWLENHFIDAVEARLQHRIEQVQLVLPCPACGSRRVRHVCVPMCCDNHRCEDCGADMRAEVAVLQRAEPLRTERRKFRDAGLGSSRTSNPGELIRTGVVRDYRSSAATCPHSLELVLLAEPGRPPELAEVAWLCETCEYVYPERGQQSKRLGFRNEVEAEVLCPVCSSKEVDNTREGGEGARCRCLSCGSELAVWLRHAQVP